MVESEDKKLGDSDTAAPVTITIKIDGELKRSFDIAATEDGDTYKDVFIRLMQRYVEDRSGPPPKESDLLSRLPKPEREILEMVLFVLRNRDRNPLTDNCFEVLANYLGRFKKGELQARWKR